MIASLLVVSIFPVAQEDESGEKVYTKQVERILEKIDDASNAYRRGERKRAYKLARSAYLDHFEFIEPYIRPQFPDQVLAWENKFFQFRNLIQKGGPQEEVDRLARQLKDEMQYDLRAKFEGATGAVSYGAAAISGSIILREGLEAVLLLAIFGAYLIRSGRVGLSKYLWYGCIFALAATGGTWLLFAYLFRISGWAGELIEVGSSLLAVAVLFYITFWVIRRLDEDRVIEFIKSSAWRAVREDEGFLVGLLTFFAIYREGFETVLFYRAMFSIYPDQLNPWLLGGFMGGLLGVIGVGVLIYRFGLQVSLGKIFFFTALVGGSLSVFFTGSAIKELQILGWLPHTALTGLPRLPAVLADLLGYRRALEPILAQMGIIVLYLAGGIWVGQKARGKSKNV